MPRNLECRIEGLEEAVIPQDRPETSITIPKDLPDEQRDAYIAEYCRTHNMAPGFFVFSETLTEVEWSARFGPGSEWAARWYASSGADRSTERP